MKVIKHPDFIIDMDAEVTVKKMGAVIEVRHAMINRTCPITKIDKDTYCDNRTGEVKEIKHMESRIDDTVTIKQSMRNLRDLINANTDNLRCVKWVTLTYAPNMQDTAKLYADLKKFNQRLRYYLKKNDKPLYEYIAALEPQGRGAWHAHVLMIFASRVAPFIPNDIMADIWGQGFTKTKALKQVDNLGVYLTAYLGDMPIDEALSLRTLHPDDKIVAAKTLTDGERKAVIKGARLALYPTGFRLFRCSRKIKRPQICRCTEADATAMLKGSRLTYQKTIELRDDQDQLINIISYRHYNNSPESDKESCDEYDSKQ